MEFASLITWLKKSGLRRTTTRKTLLQTVAKSERPLSVGELLMEIPVNKTTVYREVETLVAKGLLVEVDFGDNKKRYELSMMGHHHHLVCESCKSVQDFTVTNELYTIEMQIKAAKRFTVKRHSLEFFGVCSECTTHV